MLAVKKSVVLLHNKIELQRLGCIITFEVIYAWCLYFDWWSHIGVYVMNATIKVARVGLV